MADIYEQHAAAFSGVSAYVILHNGERVATIAFRHPTRGLRLTAYVHWLGLEMVRGSAGGGGYDKASAAVGAASRKLPEWPLNGEGETPETLVFKAFRTALDGRDGRHWDNRLRDAGFTVLQAV